MGGVGKIRSKVRSSVISSKRLKPQKEPLDKAAVWAKIQRNTGLTPPKPKP